jgi:hypothetical protein
VGTLFFSDVLDKIDCYTPLGTRFVVLYHDVIQIELTNGFSFSCVNPCLLGRLASECILFYKTEEVHFVCRSRSTFASAREEGRSRVTAVLEPKDHRSTKQGVIHKA